MNIARPFVTVQPLIAEGDGLLLAGGHSGVVAPVLLEELSSVHGRSCNQWHNSEVDDVMFAVPGYLLIGLNYDAYILTWRYLVPQSCITTIVYSL